MADAVKPLSPVAKKARLVRSYLAGRPVHCTWQLSPRCESFCHLCEHRMESAADDLDTDGCLEVAEKLGDAGSLLVSFTGADPFLRGDLPQIVEAVARRHFPLLVSHGWLVSAPVAHAVWEAGLEAAKRGDGDVQEAETRLHMSRYYEEARELARRLSAWSAAREDDERRFVVCTGGGPGIMEAANRGSDDVNAVNMGLAISIPVEAFQNHYVTPELSLEFHYFFMRKFWLVRHTNVCTVLGSGRSPRQW